MKRSRNSAIAAGLLTLAAVAGDAGAQQKTVFSLSPNTGPVSAQAIGSPGVNPSRTLPNPAPRFFNQPYPIYYNAPYPVYYNAPQTVFFRDGSAYYPGMYDNGSVYANFGRGYEVVSQACTTSQSQGVSTYVGGYQYQPTYYPVYYPYGPVQGSAGYPQKQYVSVSTSQYSSQTCYTRDVVSNRYNVRRY